MNSNGINNNCNNSSWDNKIANNEQEIIKKANTPIKNLLANNAEYPDTNSKSSSKIFEKRNQIKQNILKKRPYSSICSSTINIQSVLKKPPISNSNSSVTPLPIEEIFLKPKSLKSAWIDLIEENLHKLGEERVSSTLIEELRTLAINADKPDNKKLNLKKYKNLQQKNKDAFERLISYVLKYQIFKKNLDSTVLISIANTFEKHTISRFVEEKTQWKECIKNNMNLLKNRNVSLAMINELNEIANTLEKYAEFISSDSDTYKNLLEKYLNTLFIMFTDISHLSNPPLPSSIFEQIATQASPPVKRIKKQPEVTWKNSCETFKKRKIMNQKIMNSSLSKSLLSIFKIEDKIILTCSKSKEEYFVNLNNLVSSTLKLNQSASTNDLSQPQKFLKPIPSTKIPSKIPSITPLKHLWIDIVEKNLQELKKKEASPSMIEELRTLATKADKSIDDEKPNLKEYKQQQIINAFTTIISQISSYLIFKSALNSIEKTSKKSAIPKFVDEKQAWRNCIENNLNILKNKNISLNMINELNEIAITFEKYAEHKSNTSDEFNNYLRRSFGVFAGMYSNILALQNKEGVTRS